MQNPPPIQPYTFPQTPTSSEGIGAHQRTDAFSSLNTAISVPGLRTLFSTPLSTSTKRNKSFKISNEVIVAAIKPRPWKRQYEAFQRVGESIFVADPRQKNESIEMETLSLAQLNNVLKEMYEKVELEAKDRYGRMLNEFEQEVIRKDEFCHELLLKMADVGEDYFEDEATRNTIAYKMNYQHVIGMSRLMILEKYRLLGTYYSDDGSGPAFTAANGSRSVNIAVGGPTRDQETYNVFGAREAHQYCGFILKRRLYEERSSTTGKPVYREFYLQPWCGWTPVPPRELRTYRDDAGYVQYGTFIPAGRVSETPLQVPTDTECLLSSGITADDKTAFAASLDTVALIAGPSRAHIDLYHC